MASNRPPVDTSTLDKALEEELLRLTPQERQAVEAASKTFPGSDLLKIAKRDKSYVEGEEQTVSPDMSLLDAAKTYLGNIKVSKGRVVASPLTEFEEAGPKPEGGYLLKGRTVPSDTLMESYSRNPARKRGDLDFTTSSAYLSRLLGMPVVDVKTGAPTEQFLSLLNQQGSRPFGQVAVDVRMGRMGADRARQVTQSVAGPKSPVMTLKAFSEDPKKAREDSLRERYYFRHRDKPREDFEGDYTASDWVDDFDARMGSMSERQYIERTPIPGPEDVRGFKRMSPFEVDDAVNKLKRVWERGRIESRSNGIMQAYTRMKRLDQIPDEVLDKYSNRLPDDGEGQKASNLKELIGDTFAGARGMSLKDRPPAPMEFGIGEVMSPQTKEYLMREVDVPGEGVTTVGAALNLREQVIPAIESGRSEIAHQELMDWAQSTGADQDAMAQAKRNVAAKSTYATPITIDGKRVVVDQSGMPIPTLGSEFLSVLRDRYRERKGGPYDAEAVQRINQKAALRNDAGLYGLTAPVKKEQETTFLDDIGDVDRDIQVGLEGAASIPLKAVAAIVGASVGAGEAAGRLAGSIAGGRKPGDVKVLSPATDADRGQVQLFLARYPNLSEESKKTIGQAMTAGSDYISQIENEEKQRIKKMLSMEEMDRLKANSNEMLEGFVAIGEILVGKTGDAYLKSGKTAQDRVFKAMEETYSGAGKQLGAGAIIQLHELLSNPMKYYEANPVDAILGAMPLINAAKQDGRFASWASGASKKSKEAIVKFMRIANDTITSLDRKAQAQPGMAGALLGLGFKPINTLQQVAQKTVLIMDDVSRGVTDAKSAVGRMFRDPAELSEGLASMLMSELIDKSGLETKIIEDFQTNFVKIREDQGPRAASVWAKQKLEDVYGPDWRDKFPGVEGKLLLLDKAQDAPDIPTGKFEQTVTEKILPGVEKTFEGVVETVGEVQKGTLFVTPKNASHHGPPGVGIRSRAKHPDYAARRYLLNPKSSPDVTIANVFETADALDDMVSKKDPWRGGERPTGKESTKDLQDAGKYDSELTPTSENLNPDEFINTADERLADGLSEVEELKERARELREDYVDLLDPEVLEKYGFENERDALRSVGVMGQEYSKFLADTELKSQATGERAGASLFVKEAFLEKKQPKIDALTGGLTENTLKSLNDKIRGLEKTLGVRISRTVDNPVKTGTVGQRRTSLLKRFRELEEAGSKILPKVKSGQLKPSVLEELRAVKDNVRQALDESVKNPTLLMEAVLDEFSGGSAQRVLGPEAKRLLSKRKEMQRKSDGKDTGLSDQLSALDEQLREALVKDALGSKRAMNIGEEFILRSLERRKAKSLQEARARAVKDRTSQDFIEDVGSQIASGKKIDSLPAALVEDPQNLIDKLAVGKPMYERLAAEAKQNGVSDIAFQRSIRDARARLNKYVRADRGGKNVTDYLGLNEAEAKRTFIPKQMVAQIGWEVRASEAYSALASRAKAAWTAGNLGSHVTNYASYLQAQVGRGRGFPTPLYLLEEAQDIYAKKTPDQLGFVETVTLPDGTTKKIVNQEKYARYERMVDALNDTNFIDRTSILNELNIADKSISDPFSRKKARSVLDVIKEKSGKAASIFEEKVYGPMQAAYGGVDQIAKWEQAKYAFKYFDDMYNKMADGETITYRVNPEGLEVTVRKGKDGKIYLEEGKKSVVITDGQLADIQARASAADANSVLWDYNKLPNVVKINKILGRVGISIPYFTFLWKAIDIPGYKKGLGEAMMSGVPYTRTSDPALRSAHRGRILRNGAKINAINVFARDRLSEIPEDILKEIAGALPRQMRAAFVKHIGIPGMYGVKELDYIDGRNPTLSSWRTFADVYRGRPITTPMKQMLSDGTLTGIEMNWFADKEKGKDLDVDLEGPMYREEGGKLNDLGKRTKALRASIIQKLSRPDRRGTEIFKTFGFGAGIFADVATALEPVFAGDPNETVNVMEVMRRTGLAVAFGASAEKVVDGVIAGLEAQGVEVPKFLRSKLSKRLKQYKAPDYKALSKKGVSVVGDTLRKLTSIGFDVRDIRGDKKRYLRGVRRQLNASFLGGVNSEMAKFATLGGKNKDLLDDEKYGARTPELQEKYDKLLAHKEQMTEIVDKAISGLDNLATRALNVASRLRGDKKKGLGPPLFEMQKTRDGRMIKKEFRLDPSTGRKVYIEDMETEFELESRSDVEYDIELLDESLGLMTPEMVDHVKRPAEDMRRVVKPLEGIPVPEEEEE